MADKTFITKIKSYFSPAATRENLTSGEELQTSLGKVKKWLSDLGTAAFTNSTDYAAASHNQPSSTITAMTGYSKPQSTSAIAATDTLNEAIGKLEKAIDGAGGGGETIPPIEINKISKSNTSGSVTGNKLRINIDQTKINESPIKFLIDCGYIYSNSAYSRSYLQVEISHEGYKISSTSPTISYSSYQTFVKYNSIYNNDVQMTIYLSDDSNMQIVHDEYCQFFVSYNNLTSYQTFVNRIIPVDFTAVTNIKYGGTTVWQRT